MVPGVYILFPRFMKFYQIHSNSDSKNYRTQFLNQPQFYTFMFWPVEKKMLWGVIHFFNDSMGLVGSSLMKGCYFSEC